VGRGTEGKRKAHQKILWAEVRKESGRGKGRFTIRDLLADGRCSQAVLDFLFTTDVGRLVPPEEDAGARCRNGCVGCVGCGKRRGEWWQRR